MDVRALLETALPILEESARHTVNNIANVDTPGYVPQEVDFQSSLRNAIAGVDTHIGLARTKQNHIGDGSGLTGLVLERGKLAEGRTDGNLVDIDHEMTNLARNTYSVLSELLKKQNRLIRDVLRVA